MSSLNDWTKKKDEVKQFRPRPNLMARVVGYADNLVLLNIVNVNEHYNGPSNIALNITSLDSNLTAESMADPSSTGYKKPDAETGGVISVAAVALRNDNQPLTIDGVEYTQAESPRVFGIVNDTEQEGRISILPSVWHKEVVSARSARYEGRMVSIKPQIRTFTSFPTKAVPVKGVADLEEKIMEMCKSQNFPGRNNVGLVFRAYDKGLKVATSEYLIPPPVVHPGEEYPRPLEGKEALENFKGQAIYQQFVEALTKSVEAGDDPDIELEVFPAIKSTAGAAEIQHSGFFDENGQINESGEKVNAKFKTDDGKDTLAESGVMVFRTTDVGTIRPHIGISHLAGFNRYAGTIDQVPSANYAGNGDIPYSLFQVKYGSHAVAQKEAPEVADDLMLDNLEAEMPDEMYSGPSESVEQNFAPEPEPSAKQLKQAPPAQDISPSPDDFNPDFSESFEADFEEELHQGMGR